MNETLSTSFLKILFPAQGPTLQIPVYCAKPENPSNNEDYSKEISYT